MIRPSSHNPFVRYFTILPAAALLVACDDGTTEPPPPPETAELTVDASTTPAYIRLGDPATQVTVADPTTSTEWDLALLATSVTVNGGAAGPAGVTAACLCDNADATVAELQAMTPANQLASFDAIAAADVPAASEFVADELNPVINGWFAGSGTSATAVSNRAWIVRRTSGGVILGKFRVVTIAGASAANAGNVTVEYAIQPATGAAFGAPATQTVDLSAGPVFLNLSSGTVTSGSGWDIRLSGWEIRVNGGVSGSGGVSAVVDETMPFGQITAQYASFAPAVAYRSDAYGGVFVSSPWYRYNITGTDNQIWPNFNVYLLKRGTQVYKVQVTSYYSTAGTPRQITVRSARIP